MLQPVFSLGPREVSDIDTGASLDSSVTRRCDREATTCEATSVPRVACFTWQRAPLSNQEKRV